MTHPAKPLDIEARELLARQLEVGLYHDDAERIKVAQDGLGVICAASAIATISELLTRLREVEGERDEARLHVSKTNNSVFGSYGYFTLPDASQEIERIKESNGNHWNAEQGLRSQLSISQALLGECREVVDRFKFWHDKYVRLDDSDNDKVCVGVKDLRRATSLIEKLDGQFNAEPQRLGLE